MNASLPPVLAQALAPLAPPSSVVHRILSIAAQDIDRAMLRTKQDPLAGQRLADSLMAQEIRIRNLVWGAL